MRPSRPIFLAFCLILAALPAAADPIFGYFNPKTRTFTPQGAGAANALAADAIAAPVIVGGTIFLRGTAPFVQTLTGGGYLVVDDSSYTSRVTATATVKRSGNTGQITVRMPYRVSVLSKSEQIQVTLFINSKNFNQVTLSIPLPSNGATTVISFPQFP